VFIAIDAAMMIGLLCNQKEKGGWSNASILHEMPRQERNEEHQKHNHEEWEAGNPGRVPCVRYEDVQDRKGLKLLFHQGL
jgi:hypothetical protein